MTAAVKPRSLRDFSSDLKRKDCPVCRLPDEVRTQLGQAREKKINRNVVMAWLTEELKLKITSADLDTHGQGRHDFR